MRRTLVGGVGYRFTRDLAFGPIVVDRLRTWSWPPGVEVEDLSYAPIAIVQRWQLAPIDRLILVGAVPRSRTPGSLHRYRPDGALPDPEEVQRRVGEAVMGIISLDNLLVVANAFGVLPPDVEVIEVEPFDTSWGDGLSPLVRPAVPKAIEMVREAVGCGDQEREAIEALRQRDEILQVLFWLEGEGLLDAVRAQDLLPFIGGGEEQIAQHLESLRRLGYVEETYNEAGCYRLTVIGRAEGGRRFLEEFGPLLRQGHGECNDPDCECHRTGDPALCQRRSGDPDA